MKDFVKDLSGFMLNDVKEEKQNARYRSNSENQLISHVSFSRKLDRKDNRQPIISPDPSRPGKYN
jgi:hypothetical protein